MLTIALTASICGAETCVDFADFARDREGLFHEFPELPGGLPSHDTFSRRFRLLDPAAFATCFASSLDGLGQAGSGVIAIDGKNDAPLVRPGGREVGTALRDGVRG